MVEVYLVITGLIFFAWLYALVRQTGRGMSSEPAEARPVVPINLMESDEAIVVAEGRGRIVYANNLARQWFGMNGGTPSLPLMSQMVQPADTLYDLFADGGHGSFRLGGRRIEAVSHVVPGPEGRRMIVVMRELTAAALQSYTEFDPLRAVAIMTDISHAVGAGLDLDTTIEAVLRSIGQSINFDSAEVTLWDADTQTLHPLRSLTESDGEDVVYQVGEGYTGWIAMYRQPLLIGDIGSRTDVFPKRFRRDFQSYVGVPLVISDRFIGTLELIGHIRNAFSQRDVALLQTVAGQVAAALEAAILYREQKTHVAELSGMQQIAEAMNQLSDPAELFGQLTERIAHLVGMELCGVLLYDSDAQIFRSQPPFYGVPSSLVRTYHLAIAPESELYAIWNQPWWVANDPNTPALRTMGLDDITSAITLNSLGLISMIVGGRRIGLLMVANRHGGQGFSEADLRLLFSFASQAAVVVENSRLYLEEQRRTRELGGLQQIGQALSALRNPAELYGQITSRIAGLMQVQMCGVLLYDARVRGLISQRPFYGMDDEESINFYQLPSPPGSTVAQLWQERDTWFSNDVRHDPLVSDTDLARLAQVAGIRQTLLAALVVGGTRLGIIQASNRLTGEEFTDDDARVMAIFAGQAAMLIENARLYREMQRRAHEAEGLRAITEIASQSAPMGEMVEQVIVAIANLLQSEVVAIALVDEETGELVIQPGYVWGSALNKAIIIDAYAPGFEQSVLISRRPFISNSLRDDKRVLPQYRPMFDRFKLRTVIQAPLVVGERSIGELTIANKEGGEPFSDTDMMLVMSIATQVAAMIERSRLYQATDQDLRSRLQELGALGRVSHELSQTIDLDRILDVIRQEALRSTEASAASIVLLSDINEWVDTNTPQIDQRFGESRLFTTNLAPIEWMVVTRNDVVMISDYATSEYAPVPDTARSALAVPISFGEQPVGLIHLYSENAGAFDQRVIDFVVSLTDQAAIAISNARRYQEQLAANQQLRVRAERMGRIFELGELFRQGASLAEMLEEVAHSVQETVGFNVVLISLTDPRERVMRRTAQAGLPIAVFEEMQQVTPPLDQTLGLMQDVYRVSNSYFLPAEGTTALREGLPVYQVIQERMGSSPHAWDPQDLLLVPLYGTGGQLLGMMTVDDPRSGRRPDLAIVEALEIFANQAAFSIENYRLIERIQQEAEATRRERDRLAQLHLVTSEIQRAADVPSRLQVVADGIFKAGWGRVVITLRDEHLEPTALIHAGYTPEEAISVTDEALPGKTWRAWINDLAFHELKLGAGYYLRYNHPWVIDHILNGQPANPPSVPDSVWHPQDVFYLPLVGQDQKRIIGIIEMEDPVDGRVPTPSSLQPFELFASQAAAAIETTRLYLETVRAAEQEQRLNEMMEAVSSSLSAEGIIESIGRGLQQMIPFTRMCVALADEGMEQFRLIRADIALDTSVRVLPDIPVTFQGTYMGRIFAETSGRLFHLQSEEAVCKAHSDLLSWYEDGERTTMLVPMIAGGQPIGVLHLGSELENAFGFQENMDLIQRLANLSAVALDNARLFQQARDREQFSAALQRVSQSLNQIFDLGSVLRTICDESLPILGVEGTYAFLLVGSELIGIAASGPAQESFFGMSAPLSDTEMLAARVVNLRQPMYINDLQSRGDRMQIVPLAALESLHAVLGVPLLREERVLGALMLVKAQPGERFDDLDVEQAAAFAVQAAIAIENARLFEEAEQRAAELDAQARRLGLINRIATRLSQALALEDIYTIAVRELQAVLGGAFGSFINFEDEKTGRVVFSTNPADEGQDITIHLDNNPSIDYARETHKPIVSEDVLSDARFAPNWDILQARGTQSIVSVPLIVAEQVIGIVGIDFTERRTFSEAEVEIAETIASQVSVALEKAHLLQEAERRAIELDEQAQRLAVINRVSSRLAQTFDPEEVYRIILTEMQTALGLQSGGLMLIEGDNLARLVLSTHPMDPPVPNVTVPLIGNPAAEYILTTRQPFVIPDLYANPMLEPMWELQRMRNTSSMLIIPVLMGDQVIGTIGLDGAEPHYFTDAEIEMAQTTANQAAVAIEKARLFTEAQQRAAELDAQARRLALVNNIATRLAQTLDTQEIYRIVLSELAQVLHADFAGLVIFESEQVGRLVLDYPFDHPTPDLLLPLEGNLSIQKVRETRRPLASADVLNDPLFEQAWTNLKARGTQSLMIVPLLVGDKVIGTIGLDVLSRREFTEAEIGLAETIASQASLATEKARLYNETLNLTIFNEAVVESIQQGIVVLDLNLNVRRVNSFMVERYGWDESAVGRSLYDYRPDYAEFLRTPMIVALGTGEPQISYEVERRDAAGRRTIRNYYVYPMLERRRVTGLVLLVEDVTERATLEADLESRAIQMAALSEVSSQITSTLDPNQLISLVLDALGRVIPYDGVSLWLRAPEREELNIVAARGYQDADSPDASELVGLRVEIPYSPLFREMAAQAKVINAVDVSAGDPRFPYGGAAVYKNWLGAPLISKGRVVGVLALEKREPNFYNVLHEQLALTFANQAAVALDNAQMFQETRARAAALDEQAQRLALLNRVSLALAQSLDVENIFEIALRESAIALDLPEGCAIQIEIESQLGRVIVEYPRGDLPPEQVYDLSSSEAFERIRRGLIPLAIENFADEPAWADLRPMMRRDDVCSTLLIPLVVGGEVIGVLRLDSPGQIRQFSEEQIELAQTIASQAGIAVQNASLFEQTSIRSRELETLFESAQATAVTLDLNEVVRRVTMQMLAALRADACTVFLWDDVNNRLEVRGDISARGDNMPPDQPGYTYDVSGYPLRERSLRDRELIIVRATDTGLSASEAELMARHHAAIRILIPLVVNEISIGLVEVESLDSTRYFKAEELRLGRTLASQAAISIENARLQTETRRTVEELYIINDMSTALSSAANMYQLLDVVADQLPNLTEAQAIYVALYEPPTQSISFPLAVVNDQPVDMPPRHMGADEFSLVIRRQSPLLLVGDNLDAVRRNLGLVSAVPDVRSFLGVPLFAGEEVVGVLAVGDNKDPLAFSHNDQRILNTVGAQLGVAIQSARLFQQTLQLAEELEQRVRERTAELEQERQHISTLYQITTELSMSLDMDRLLNRALEMVAHSVGASQGAILAVDPISDRMNYRASYGFELMSDNGDGKPASIGMTDGLAGWAIQTHQSLISNDVQSDPRWLRLSDMDDRAQAALIALVEANEDVLGVVMLTSDHANAFTEDHLRLVTAAANQIANSMNNAELYSLIRDQAERLGAMLRQEQVEATKSASILESVADGVMVADSNGQVIVFNSTAERILGLPAERILNQPTSRVSGLYAGGTRWAEVINRWIEHPAEYQPGEFLEDRITLEDDRVISVRISPVHMGDQYLGTVSIFRDITREVEVDRLKSEFVATVSHELRTPMTSIKGYADLLLLGAAGDISEQQQRFLETIKQNADRLSVLVNDLLDISRIDQGRVEMKFGPVDVEDVFNTVLAVLRGRADEENRPMNIDVHLPQDQRLSVWGDYDKVAQIFTNLGDNAFNYTMPGGTITLSAEYNDENGCVFFSIGDTGIGIDPAIRERIFERFFRGDETHELVMDTPGTGLGLAIVQEYVQLHHGRIWFESEVGKGSTFYVELPSNAPGVSG